MKIYTKTGDSGRTGLYGGARVAKDDVRIEAYGTVDELNAFLGLALCETRLLPICETLVQVQNELFCVGAELATPDPTRHGTDIVTDKHVAALERAIDDLQSQLPELRQFILPGGERSACLLHVARGVCRRAERRVVTLAATAENAVSERIIRYLNRLSDYLFVAARAANAAAENPDVPWEKPD